jgi:hypothetical protein
LAYDGNAASYSNTVTDPRFALLPADLGPVPNDELHHGTISAVVDLPWGFQVAPILQAASARPYDATNGVSNVLGFGSGPATAHDLVQASSPSNLFWSATQSSAALKACYLAGTCVQLPYDSLRGQPYFNIDTRVSKSIKIKEHSDLKLMFQAFDLTNRANFGNNYDGNVRHFNAASPSTSSFATPLGYIGCNANGCNRAIPISFRAEFGAQFTF